MFVSRMRQEMTMMQQAENNLLKTKIEILLDKVKNRKTLSMSINVHEYGNW